MITNYIKTAWRNIERRKTHSFINIAGLAVGMAISMLIGLWVHDELSYNTNHDNYERIGRLAQHHVVNGETETLQSVPIPLAAELKSTYRNDFRNVILSWWEGAHVLSIEDKKVSQSGTFIEGSALEMFSFDMVSGSRESLRDPASVILSESAARALFGDDDPMDKLIRIDDALDVKVTGIFREFPSNSHLHGLQFVSTWDLFLNSFQWLKDDEDNWSSEVVIYAELEPGTTFEAVSEKIKDTRLKHLPDQHAKSKNPELFIHPMSRWHLYSEWKNGAATGGRIQVVWLFCIIGVFVLLLACINFMNLSTAQSEKRAKEVGIRKSIGSGRRQLIHQFLAESYVVVIAAFVLSLALVTGTLPWFNDLAAKKIEIPWTNGYFWLISIVFIGVTGVMSGSYPALFLSSFQPVKVLKGSFKAGRFSAVPRKVLVVIQFTVSVTLIIGTVVVWNQINFAKDRPIGYSKEGLIMIRKKSPEYWGKSNLLRNQLKASGAISEISESSGPATEVWFNSAGFNWRGKDPNTGGDFACMGITHDYGKTMGWTFVNGRDFSRQFSTDSAAAVLNETAANSMGLEDPVGEELEWDGRKLKIIGVIKDMIMDSPYEPVKQTVFWLNYEGNVWINIRLNPELSASDALGKIKKVFNDLFPSVLFEYNFVDDQYAQKFAAEERVGKCASLFAGLAVFISCLGLYGIASFMAEQRRKEIGIRKVLGASTANLWNMLSGEFVVLTGISCLIAVPVAWYFLEEWLSQYEYRTVVSPVLLIGISIGAVAIALVTVSFQLIKVAVNNPVDALRSE